MFRKPPSRMPDVRLVHSYAIGALGPLLGPAFVERKKGQAATARWVVCITDMVWKPTHSPAAFSVATRVDQRSRFYIERLSLPTKIDQRSTFTHRSYLSVTQLIFDQLSTHRSSQAGKRLIFDQLPLAPSSPRKVR